ncbi:MAG: hypothetical protein JWP91_3137 [Fibrobacteres bacterium]|nr:hypothetical protein [Fibrobacterota bacterium]
MGLGTIKADMGIAAQKGFTFLEVMVVVIVMGLLALLAFNPMRNYLHRMEFKNCSQNVKHLIQTAQSKAMGNPNVHIGVFFDRSTTPHKAFLFQDKLNPASYRYDGSGDPAYLQPEKLKAGMSFKTIPGYPPEIVFRGDGSAWKSMKIILTDGTLQDTLDILASTGRVRVGK